MLNTPKVSVCVTTYNHAHYIHDCLMSVIAQSKDVSLEILVGDDQSDDGASTIIEALANEYPDLIRYFRHEKRLGGCKNYQFVMQQAKGSFIAYLDGDDFWLPGKLIAQVRFMEQNQECSAVYSNALAISNDGMLLGVFNNQQPTKFDINYLLRRGNFLNHSSMLYRASLREDLLSLQSYFLDYLIHLRHAKHGTIGYLNQALVGYRVNSSSSIIVHANDDVRRFYWEALLDTPRESIIKDDLAKGMADFMRRIFFRSIRLKSWSLVRKWWPCILTEAPAGRGKMIFWTVLAILHTGFFEIVEVAYARIGGSQMRILYRR